MKPVRRYDRFHVVPPEPDRASTSKRRIARCEHDLFVTAHAQHFLWQDQRSRRQLL
jgi:hypothetical protein